MSQSKLLKNTTIFLIGNFGSRILSFLLIPLYTHYLTPKDYGVFDIIVTTLFFVAPVVSFQLGDGIYRYLLNEKDSVIKDKIISTSLFQIIINLIVVNLLFLVAQYYLKIQHSILILFYYNTFILLTILKQIARGLKSNIDYAFSGIIVTFFTLIFNLIFIIVYNYRLEALLISGIIGNLTGLLYIIFRFRIFKRISFEKVSTPLLKSLLKFSIPLISNSLTWWIISSSNRYFITFFLDSSANGIFAISNRMVSIIVIFNYMFNLAWQENMISESNNSNNNYSKTFKHYINFQFGASSLFLSLSILILPILIKGVDYNESWKYIPFLLVGSIFQSFSSFYGTAYLKNKNTKGAMYTSLSGVLANIIFNIILIPRYGIQGACISVLISFLLIWLIRTISLSSLFKSTTNYKLIIIHALFISFFVLFYFNHPESLLINTCFFLITLTYFILSNKYLINILYSLGFNKFKKIRTKN